MTRAQAQFTHARAADMKRSEMTRFKTGSAGRSPARDDLTILEDQISIIQSRLSPRKLPAGPAVGLTGGRDAKRLGATLDG